MTKIKPESGAYAGIEPNYFYKTDELAKILKVHPNTILNLKEKFGGEKLGKSWKFLGENVLAFFGAPSVSRMKPGQ